MNGNRRLIVMRHAKSAWDTEAQSDHARPLNHRGLRDAPRVGRRLLSMGWLPDRVLLSDAVRTRQTLEHLFKDASKPPEEELDSRLYLGGIEEIRSAVGRQSDSYGTLMVLGHNPGWEDSLLWLCGVHERLTTANAALLRTAAPSWNDAMAQPEQFVLMSIIRPRDLTD